MVLRVLKYKESITGVSFTLTHNCNYKNEKIQDGRLFANSVKCKYADIKHSHVIHDFKGFKRDSYLVLFIHLKHN